MGEKTGLTSRLMEPEDIKEVALLEAEAFSDPWNEIMLLNELSNALSHYIVLVCGGNIVGYAGFWLVAGEAQITRVAVKKEFRGQGLGKKLTEAAVQSAWQCRAEAITLEVRESNLAARKVYESCGFSQNGLRPNYYGDNNENAVIMWCYREGTDE